MNLRRAAAAAAVIALSVPNWANAGATLSYDDMIYCSAFNTVMAEVIAAGTPAPDDKTRIAKYNRQADALLGYSITFLPAGKTALSVNDDAQTQHDVVLTALTAKDTGTDYLKAHYSECMTLGVAAVAIDGK